MTRALLIATLAFAGCSLTGLDPQVVNLCASDDECGEYVCDTDRGMCVGSIREPYEVALEVTPNSASTNTPPAWRSHVVSLTEARAWEVRFDAHVEVLGTVRWQGRRVPAEIIFSRPGLEGRPVQRFRTETLAEPQPVPGVEGGQYDFSLRAPAGGTYDVEIRPSSAIMDETGEAWLAVLPPRRLTLDPLPMGEPGEPGPLLMPWSFDYPEGLETQCSREVRMGCTLTGSVVAMVDGEAEAEEGLQVRAVDELGQVVSSAAVTDEDGVFSLVLSPNAGSYVLRVSATMDRPLFPTILVDPAFLTGDLRIRVPGTRVIAYEGTVETPTEQGLAGATVTFRSSSVVDGESGITGSFETTVTSDEGGDFEANLLAGDYEVVVTPLTGQYTVLVEELTIAPADGVERLQGQLFRLQRASQLGATIVDFLGRELPQSTADASALAERFEDLPAAAFNRSQMATADETGQLIVPLDVGAYDLTFRASASSGYPWAVSPGVKVLESGETVTERIELQAPVPISGQVTGPDGSALVDAEVRALARIPETGRFVEIARGRTAADGTYELLLPPAL